MPEELSEQARAIVAEEEALLARAQAALRAKARPAPARDTHGLVTHLKELRDEAATASERDLPALFTEMHSTRALLDREEIAPPPDPDTPYFAHLKLKSAQGSRDYLLGKATFIDLQSGVRIVDWRYAPVARIFYSYQEGDPYEEELPGGMAEGEVEARRVVVVERGQLTRILAGSLILVRGADGAWRDGRHDATLTLGGGAGSAARPGILGVGHQTTRRAGHADITALLDHEQFEALSVGAERPLLVLGSAGSGKTTVALHRLAKLAFEGPQQLSAIDMRVVVPEEGLARLSRRLLAPLGLRKVQVETLGAWLVRTANTSFGQRGIKLCEEPPSLVTSLKRHPALRAQLAAHLPALVQGPMALPALRRRLADLLSDRTFLTKVVDAANGELPRTAIEKTVRHTMLQLATPMSREFSSVDAERMATVDGLSLDEGTPDELAGSYDLEDLAILLRLQAHAGAMRAEPLAHLVLDETEDFSLVELEVLGEQLGDERSCTLAGDEMQQTHSSFAGWDASLAALGVKDPAVCRLQVSYRCPRPVAELAQKVLGPLAPASPARPGRDGAPVGFHHFPDEAQTHLFLAGALRDLLDREPDASVGVIASSADQARAMHLALESLPRVRLVQNGEFSFEPGVDVTDVDQVKGLEFDYVILPDVTAAAFPATDEARHKLHVAVTRTSHQLWVVSSGNRSPLVR